MHHAAGLAIAELRRELGEQYVYDADEQHKLVFAAAVDQPTLAMLESDLLVVESAEERAVFSHPPDEFIRIVIPTGADFARLALAPHLGGEYDDATRTAVSMRLGQFVTHEFTHALHAADQHALGQEHPVWLSEGLATLFESGEIDDGKYIAHDNARLKFVRVAAKSGELPALETLVRMTRQDFSARPNLAYGESGCLLQFLQETGLLKAFYDAYVAGYEQDPTGAAALEKVTGSSLASLRKAFVQWILDRPVARAPRVPAGRCWAWESPTRSMACALQAFLPAVPRCRETSRSEISWWQWTARNSATARLSNGCWRRMNRGKRFVCDFAGRRSMSRRW